eukprot:Filipodium_phascolosomae@DN2439_c0_g1_i8.p1
MWESNLSSEDIVAVVRKISSPYATSVRCCFFFLIPYRDRLDNMRSFIIELDAYVDTVCVPLHPDHMYMYCILHQADTSPFNRGFLLNCGSELLNYGLLPLLGVRNTAETSQSYFSSSPCFDVLLFEKTTCNGAGSGSQTGQTTSPSWGLHRSILVFRMDLSSFWMADRKNEAHSKCFKLSFDDEQVLLNRAGWKKGQNPHHLNILSRLSQAILPPCETTNNQAPLSSQGECKFTTATVSEESEKGVSLHGTGREQSQVVSYCVCLHDIDVVPTTNRMHGWDLPNQLEACHQPLVPIPYSVVSKKRSAAYLWGQTLPFNCGSPVPGGSPVCWCGYTVFAVHVIRIFDMFLGLGLGRY